MTKTILMGASFLALLAAYPAFAADTSINANTNVSTESKIENTLDKAGDSIKKTSEEASNAVKAKYSDVKAYFSDKNDVAAITSVNVHDRLTADELIGTEVQDPSGKEIGKIADILVNKSGEAQRVIINDGGILGLGGKMASFDYGIIQGFSKDKDVQVKLTEDSIKAATAFDENAKADAKVAGIPADMYSVKKIIGSKVVDDKGKAVAKVDTVAMDSDNADYLIVTFNKILGVGGDKAALNFDALDLTNNNGKYTFKLNTQQTAQFENYKETTKAN